MTDEKATIEGEVISQKSPPIKLDEQTAKITACTAEINAALDKYGCDLDVSMILRPGSPPTASVQIVIRKS